MSSYWDWRQEAKLWRYQVWAWITWDKYWFSKAQGLSDLKIHVETGRYKQSQPYKGEKTFNLYILKRDKWICYLCLKPIAYGYAQVEHDLPLIRWGKTDEYNCHAAHDTCNLAKGTKTAAEYWTKYG